MDKIIIKHASLLGHIGVSDEERKKKQELILDIEMLADTREAGARDDLGETVCYADVYERVARIVKGKPHRLIESVAEELAKEILAHFAVRKVLVRVKKPGAFAGKDVRYAAVEITREKNG